MISSSFATNSTERPSKTSQRISLSTPSYPWISQFLMLIICLQGIPAHSSRMLSGNRVAASPISSVTLSACLLYPRSVASRSILPSSASCFASSANPRICKSVSRGSRADIQTLRLFLKLSPENAPTSPPYSSPPSPRKFQKADPLSKNDPIPDASRLHTPPANRHHLHTTSKSSLIAEPKIRNSLIPFSAQKEPITSFDGIETTDTSGKSHISDSHSIREFPPQPYRPLRRRCIHHLPLL